ncbi:hypothetical protein BDV25DRAFT_159736 [Aspergillus avenaceus]|uniref:Uncharacterized protein n=1 Tax=Aspergillus avenaceus TaxID=36643 RepID=A0A5N6TN21_ASPAV|nr:hypothetical protein BDV25DRAFT_159736 [Aspergillus avenaceus]
MDERVQPSLIFAVFGESAFTPASPESCPRSTLPKPYCKEFLCNMNTYINMIDWT